MKQHYLVMDTALCHDCNNCFVACKDEHCGNEWLPYTKEQPWHGHRWMNIERSERGQYPRVDACFLAKPCQHCADAPCIKAFPAEIYRRDDGIVLIDAEKAAGKKEILDSCPYGAIYWNDESKTPQKCTFCAHILDGKAHFKPGLPRCVHSCPTGSLSYYYIEPDEFEKIIEAEKLETLHPEFGSRPHVYYKNLYRITRHFIAGGLVSEGVCVEGAEVSLTGDTERPAQATNYFGDFKFDGLLPGTYTIIVNGKDFKTVSITESINLGNLSIAK